MKAMALYNSKPVFMILIPFLMMHQNAWTSFEFPNFSGPYRNEIFTFQGDASASASNGAISLTKVVNDTALPNSSGRASYALPVRLWDAKNGKTASFTTSFSFVVTRNINGAGLGDGLTFFLAPFQSEFPKDSGGGYLGLFSPDSALQTLGNRIVAVEFDTFSNPWDPHYHHIGIDVNSIKSVVTVPWPGVDYGLNTTISATVAYEPVATNLSVVVSYTSGGVLNGSVISLSLSHLVDLKRVLPELVSVGFSASTGDLVEINNILSWSFSSAFY